jgi:hypothetical protein
VITSNSRGELLAKPTQWTLKKTSVWDARGDELPRELRGVHERRGWLGETTRRLDDSVRTRMGRSPAPGRALSEAKRRLERVHQRECQLRDAVSLAKLLRRSPRSSSQEARTSTQLSGQQGKLERGEKLGKGP